MESGKDLGMESSKNSYCSEILPTLLYSYFSSILT